MMKKNIFIMIFIILVTTSFSVYAFDFSGTLTYSGQYSLSEKNLSNNLNLELSVIHDFSDEIFAEGSVQLKYNDQSTNSLMVAPSEIYIGAYDLIPGSDLRVGRLIIGWGSADMFSPLDNFNPIPLRMSLTDMDQKLAVLAADFTYYFDDMTYLQTIILPSFVPAYIPEQLEQQLYLSMFGPQFQTQGIDVGSIIVTRNQPEKPVWGVKLGRSFSSFDAAISYYNGYYLNAYPESMDLAPNSADFDLNLDLGYPERSVYGFEFQGDFPGIEGATLRGDLAYIIPQSWQFQGEDVLNNPYLKAVIGADYTTSFDLYFNVSYIWGFATEEGDQCSPYIALNARKELEDSQLTPNYIGIISLEDGSMINAIGGSYDVNDDFSISLTYVSVSGESTSKLGQMKSSSGIYLGGEWIF